MTRRNAGQVLVGALVLMTVLIIVVGAMVEWLQTESRWTVKQKRSTTAFHLAEAAVERGLWKLQEHSNNWTNTSTGTIVNYSFDKVFTDIEGGSYAINISSHPTDSDKRIIEGVGRDSSTNEVRRVKVIFDKSAGSFATRAKKTVSIAASCNIHWGPVIAGQSLSVGSRAFPRFYSAGNITNHDSNASAEPNTDNVQWWSYFSIPPDPILDFNFYLSSAQASGSSADSDCGAYYRSGNVSWSGCTDLGWKTFYITGNLTLNAGGTGNHVRGNVIVLGDIIVVGNGGSNNANGNYNAHLPEEAWKEYGNSWATYQAFDTGEPATYNAAVAQSYLASPTATYPLTNILVHGFIYTGGSQGLTGGGNGRFHGVLMSANNATFSTSNFTLYYDDTVAAGIRTTNLTLTQSSWEEVKGDWPSGL